MLDGLEKEIDVWKAAMLMLIENYCQTTIDGRRLTIDD